MLGGIDGSDASTGAVWRIDPSSGKASRVGDLDPPVHDAAGVRHGDDFWVIAGGTPPVRSAVQSVRIGGPTRTLGHLPQARADHVAAVVRNTTFVLGGGDEASTLVADVVASDDGVTWRSAGVLAEPVRYPAVALVGDAIYLFGGLSTKSGVDTGSIGKRAAIPSPAAAVKRSATPARPSSVGELGINATNRHALAAAKATKHTDINQPWAPTAYWLIIMLEGRISRLRTCSTPRASELTSS